MERLREGQRVEIAEPLGRTLKSWGMVKISPKINKEPPPVVLNKTRRADRIAKDKEKKSQKWSASKSKAGKKKGKT